MSDPTPESSQHPSTGSDRPYTSISRREARLRCSEVAVGFLSTMFGLGGNRDDNGGPDTYDLDHCPYCGSALQGFGCVYCNVEFVMEDGQLVERGLSRRGSREERRCIACDRPMPHGGEFVAAWEDGNNADSYVRCPRCGHHNAF